MNRKVSKNKYIVEQEFEEDEEGKEIKAEDFLEKQIFENPLKKQS